MIPSPGIEPETQWWKASALTTAPTLLPKTRGIENMRLVLPAKLFIPSSVSLVLLSDNCVNLESEDHKDKRNKTKMALKSSGHLKTNFS